MLSLDSRLKIPNHVVFSKVAQTSVVLNTKTKKYYSLDEVGARFWDVLKSDAEFRRSYQIVLSEYDVSPGQLEKDLLELVQNLLDAGLVELDQD